MATYEIQGGDILSLSDLLLKSKLVVFNLTFSGNKYSITINASDEQKLFAICRNMCYNVKRRRYKGIYSLIDTAKKNFGLILGVVLFTVLSVVFDGYIGEIEYSGEALAKKSEIKSVLNDNGVNESGILSLGENQIKNTVLSSVKGFSFLSVKKAGRVLIIEGYLEKEKPTPLNEKKDEIVSTHNGKVLSINLLSGKATVSVGDSVKVGTVLIVGEYEGKDGEIKKTYALGEVEIEVEERYSYNAPEKSEKYLSRAVALAKEKVATENILSINSEYDKGVYTVIITYSITVN